jgi:hypothetical protein
MYDCDQRNGKVVIELHKLLANTRARIQQLYSRSAALDAVLARR